MGFGVFSLVEGVVDHQLLGIHHVNETVPREEWIYGDVGFLAWGAAMLIGGWLALAETDLLFVAIHGCLHSTAPALRRCMTAPQVNRQRRGRFRLTRDLTGCSCSTARGRATTTPRS